MYETVIVPLDGSCDAELALPVAVGEAQRHRAMLVLLHVIPGLEAPHGADHPTRSEPTSRAVDQGRRYLDMLRQRSGLGPETIMTVVVGDPAKRILDAAKRLPGALIVMTTGDMTDRSGRPVGRVARQVLTAGNVPVLGVRGRAPVEQQAPEMNEAGEDGVRQS